VECGNGELPLLPVPKILAAKIPEILAGQLRKKAGRSRTAKEEDREISSKSDCRVGGGEVPVRA
jgi:hypothetical protein